MRGGAWKLSDFDRRLTIENVRPSDGGSFTCTAHYESHVDAAGSDHDQPTATYAHQINVTVELRVIGGSTYVNTTRNIRLSRAATFG